MEMSIHDCLFSWCDTVTSIGSGGAKLVLRTQTYLHTELMRSCKFNKKKETKKKRKPQTNRLNSVIIETATILNIIHNIFNLRDTEVVICIILVLLKRADDLNHYLNII